MELEQYRDRWLFEGVDDYIGFYTREFFALDNFSSFGIMMDGKFYPTVEHAYQAGEVYRYCARDRRANTHVSIRA